MNYHDPRSAPRAGYDKALAFEICNRYGDGESLEEILAEPGMLEAAIFFQWVAEHPELNQQFRAKGKRRKMLAEQNYALELTKKEERSQAKYRARVWEDTYALIGAPPVLSRESKEAYAQLLTVFTERLQPQGIIAQFMVKQAVDATWEEIRFAREKTQLLEQSQQDAGRPRKEVCVLSGPR
jgi:hypothetical protein